MPLENDYPHVLSGCRQTREGAWMRRVARRLLEGLPDANKSAVVRDLLCAHLPLPKGDAVMRVFIDFETYWDPDNKYGLKSMKTEEYVRDSRFHAFGCGVQIGEDEPVLHTIRQAGGAVRPAVVGRGGGHRAQHGFRRVRLDRAVRRARQAVRVHQDARWVEGRHRLLVLAGRGVRQAAGLAGRSRECSKASPVSATRAPSRWLTWPPTAARTWRSSPRSTATWSSTSTRIRSSWLTPCCA